MVKRSFRLTRSTDLRRVRRFGKSHAHPLIVLIALPDHAESSQFAIIAGKSIGKAVQRNRARRLLRAALHPYLPSITPGWQVILIARRPLLQASFQQIQAAVVQLLQRAALVDEIHGS